MRAFPGFEGKKRASLNRQPAPIQAFVRIRGDRNVSLSSKPEQYGFCAVVKMASIGGLIARSFSNKDQTDNENASDE